MQYFQSWGDRLDFATLRLLQLWEVPAGTLRFLCTHSFASLKTLALDLDYPQDLEGEEYNTREACEIDSAASAFLSGVPPLKSVHLSGFPSPKMAFHTILNHHGETLHTLSLVASGAESLTALVTVSQLEHIQKLCPRLRNLRIPVLRTQGAAAEVLIYKSLGRFTHLTNLLIQFHLEAHKPDLEPFDGDPLPPTVPSAEMLLNLAVDDTLAREILTTIVTSGAHSVQHLKVTRSKAGIPPDLDGIASVMMRQWSCTKLRVNQSNEKGPGIEIGVREIARKARILRQNQGIELGDWEVEFRKLWPAMAVSGRWEDDWGSFPLELETGGD
jgi:hypothetical protein